ncbi:uncharacterized protein LOC132599917 [Lycium barbarum]|uniref:uncharacterized protein LOC132599917 n=1 Tax=Lycium barbarum TaxID=112863 RepID=UPI00293E6A6D|nr:uncharacterized protein LOC132599917 [Lycium barbarum]
MSLSAGASDMVQDLIIISDDSDGGDSSKTHGLTSVADNESTLRFVEINQEVDQEDVTSHSVRASQYVDSYLTSPPRDTGEKKTSPPVPMKGTVIPGRSAGGVSSPKKPYRSLRMNACNNIGVVKKEKKKRAKKSAPKRKKSAK